ncbi:MAG: hypothetical protein ABI382_13490 [Nakamurella sp.]
MLQDQPVIAVVGPFAGLQRRAVVAAVRRVAKAAPHMRIALSRTTLGRRWRHNDNRLDEWWDGLVTCVPPATCDTIEEIAIQQNSVISVDHPLHFVVAGEYLIIVRDHCLGDGKVLVDLLGAVVNIAMGGTEDPDWSTLRLEPLPLLRAVRATFLRSPQTCRALLVARRLDSGGEAITENRDLTAWSPKLAVVYAVSPVTVQRRLRKWARSTDDAVTVSSALLVALRRAFDTCGVTPEPEQSVIYDIRRYLPNGSGVVNGNFITGLTISGSAVDDPAQVGGAMQTHVDSGRPLAALVAGVLRHWGRRCPMKSIVNVPRNPQAHLVFNNMGTLRTLQRLPWSQDADHRKCMFAVEPAGPEHVTVTLATVAGALHLSASFHANVFDVNDVRHALALAATNPLMLLGVDNAAKTPPALPDKDDNSPSPAEPTG